MPVHESAGSQRDAASTIFNLPDDSVIDAVDLPDGSRRVVIAAAFLLSPDPPMGGSGSIIIGLVSGGGSGSTHL